MTSPSQHWLAVPLLGACACFPGCEDCIGALLIALEPDGSLAWLREFPLIEIEKGFFPFSLSAPAAGPGGEIAVVGHFAYADTPIFSELTTLRPD